MTIRIDDPEVEQLVHTLAQRTGQTATQIVATALRERLAREDERTQEVERMVQEAMAIGRHCAGSAVLDARPSDELLDYDEHGLPRR